MASMSAAVSNIMYPMHFPKFIAASASNQNIGDGNTNGGKQANQNGYGDQLDFDLLAEYLLDDTNLLHYGESGNNAISVSQNANSTVPSTINTDVGHEGAGQQVMFQSHLAISSTSFADPLADAASMLRANRSSGTAATPSGDLACDLAQVQQLIAARAAVPAPVPQPLAHPSVIYTNITPVPTPIMTSPAATHPVTYTGHKRPYLDQSNDTSIPQMKSFNTNINNANNPQNKITQRQKSQVQIERRRERNRILARRTRLRKKFFFESLQSEVLDLQRENLALKDIIKVKIPAEISGKILEECNVGELPSIVAEMGCQEKDMHSQDFSLACSLKNSQQCFVITDPSLQDNPIVYASDDFLNLTGYTRDKVLGRNCRFLQGEKTSQEKVDKIRKSLSVGEDVSVCFLNYTADGTAFWNNLFIAALRDTQNNIVNFIGVIVKVAGPPPNDPEAGKKLPQYEGEDVDGIEEAVSAAAALTGEIRCTQPQSVERS